ncbi:MAG: hypothetical protein RLZ12_216 [Bacillota bacterium]
MEVSNNNNEQQDLKTPAVPSQCDTGLWNITLYGNVYCDASGGDLICPVI